MMKLRISGRVKAVGLASAVAGSVVGASVLGHGTTSFATDTTIPECVSATIYVTQPPWTPYVCPFPR